MDPVLLDISTNLIKHAIQSTLSAGSSKIENFSEKMKMRFRVGFSDYLVATYEELKGIPTLYKLGELIDISTSFEEMSLKSEDNKIISQEDIIAFAEHGFSAAIEAQAGAGKSFLMRYVFVRMFISNSTKIPVFIELRDLNHVEYDSFYTFVANRIGLDPATGAETIRFGMSKGIISLLLDGFDEIRSFNRDKFIRNLIEIRKNHPNTSIIMSGRQNDYFTGLGRVPTYRIQPLDLFKVRSLIKNSKYEKNAKDAFLNRLTPEFFKKHESFLNNPLLSLLMMITYSYANEVPPTLHVFYQRAYDALCFTLDSIKNTHGQKFRRLINSNLDYLQLADVFSAFSALTYVRGKIKFQTEEFHVLMRESLRVSKIDSNLSTEEIIGDFYEGICLFYKEGFEYIYTHRSFQEYFAARYFINSPGDKLKRFLNSGKFRINDNVIPMLVEMNRGKVIFDWVRETLDLFNIPGDENISPDEAMLLRGWPTLVISLDGDGDKYIHFEANSYGRKLLVLSRMFPSIFAIYDENKRSMTRRKFVEVSSEFLSNPDSDKDDRLQLALDAMSEMKKDGEAFMIKRIEFGEEDIPWMRKLGIASACANDISALRDIGKLQAREFSDEEFFDNSLFFSDD